MNWLTLTFISVFFRSCFGVMTKVLSNRLKVSAYTQAALLPAAAAVLTVAISPLLGGIHLELAHISMIAIVLVVVGQGLGNMAYFAAIKNLTNGTAQIAFSSLLVFNTVLSLLFLNLHLRPINILGLFLLMLAILSVVSGRVELHKRGIALMVLSALLFSVFQISSSEVSRQTGAVTYLLIAYLGAAAIVFILKWRVIVQDLQSAELRPTLGIPFLAALPSLGNFLFAYYAYRIAPEPAKVAMLLTSQVVLTVFFSYLFLNERDHLPRKAMAALLVVVSAILIKS
jgi:drug/metabolite transporter (DMT)-like permease